jgi:hypothetical protein
VAKQPATPAPINDNRRERILAYMVMASVGLSIVAFLSIIGGTFFGAGNNNGFSHGIWPTIFVLPLIGLPIGLVLMMTLLVLNAVRRSRAARDAGR